MTDLFWPGDHRAGTVFSGGALITALVRVEAAWLRVLVDAGIAPNAAAGGDVTDLVGLVDPAADAELIAIEAESGGNPVIPLVDLLRTRAADRDPGTARWLHRGLTSQDVLDTALMLCVRDALDQLTTSVRGQVGMLRDLAEHHRHTVQAGRTLTQHAVPTTFGLTAAGWLTGVLDAAEEVARVRGELPAQVGGAAGTLAAVTELAALAGATDPVATAMTLADNLAARLDLTASPPWHTHRRTVTRIGDALVSCTDAWGRLANDVLLRARPEIGELTAGAGGSSTMPHKRNPVLAVLVRRAALAAPPLGAGLHAASAAADDERPDGAWHAEWAALRTLARMTVVAGSQTADLLDGLVVHPDRMRATVEAALPDLLAERQAIRAPNQAPRDQAPRDLGGGADDYLGATEPLIDAAFTRAEEYLRR